MAQNEGNYTLKASVFEDLFSDENMRFRLYQSLHPEDQVTVMEDVREITLSNIFLKGRYNDLGMMVGDKLILLVEAQSTWSVNIIPRCIMYLADTWNRYGVEKEFNWYGAKKVDLPEAELYVVYTGDKKLDKKEITLSQEFYNGKKTALEATVKVLTYDGGDDILDQYITFCAVLNEQRRKFSGDDRLAITETIRICIARDVLADYLKKRAEEVVTIMLTLFTQQQAHDMEIANERKEARAEGRKEGRTEGEEMLVKLINCMIADHEDDKIPLVVADSKLRSSYYHRYGIG